jgi:hypothetical protein
MQLNGCEEFWLFNHVQHKHPAYCLYAPFCTFLLLYLFLLILLYGLVALLILQSFVVRMQDKLIHLC